MDSDQTEEEKDGALRILQSASNDDKEAIKTYFEQQKTKEGSTTKIDLEMERLQSEISALDQTNSDH